MFLSVMTLCFLDKIHQTNYEREWYIINQKYISKLKLSILVNFIHHKQLLSSIKAKKKKS